MKILALIAALASSGILINIRVHSNGSYVSPSDAYTAASSACAAMAVRGTGTVRYFCDCQTGADAGCTAGNDSTGAGTIGSPWQTYSKAITTFNAMSAGDTIAFCRGGVWNAGTTTYTLNNASCSAAADPMAAANTTTCDIRDYQAGWGGTNKPKIKHTSTGSGNYLLNFQGSSPRAGVRVLNLGLYGSGSGPSTTDNLEWGVWLRDNNDDHLFCNNTFDGWDIAFNSQGGAGLLNRWRFTGNRVTNSSTQGMLVMGNSFSIDANYFDNNGSTENRDHTIYVTAHDGVANSTILNNEMRYSVGGCQGTTVVVHGSTTNLNIENNIIDGGPSNSGGCYGVEIDRGGYTEAEGFTGSTVRRNFILNTGNIGIAMDSSVDPIVENNVLVVTASGDSAINIPQRARVAKDLASTGATIRNNTIYITSGNGGINQVNEGTGYIVANNSIYFSGTASTCFTTALAAGSYSFAGNNACYGYSSWGNSIDTTGRVTTNPNYTSPTTDFTPQAGSPLLGAGSWAVAPTTDLKLKTRPNPPAIGALER